MTKAEELAAVARGEGCLGCSQDDEPVFILVGRDRLAADTVRAWARDFRTLRIGLGTFDDRAKAKYDEAIALAQRMDIWRQQHDGGKVPD